MVVKYGSKILLPFTTFTTNGSKTKNKITTVLLLFTTAFFGLIYGKISVRTKIR